MLIYGGQHTKKSRLKLVSDRNDGNFTNRWCAGRLVTCATSTETHKFNHCKLLMRKAFMAGKAIQFYQLDQNLSILNVKTLCHFWEPLQKERSIFLN